jgi:phage gp36-like protein
MIWLTEEDIEVLIKEDILEQVLDETSEDDNDPLKDGAEQYAIAEVTDYINVRYDTNAIFSASGNNRHQSILRITLDLFLYHLHSRVNPGSIPETRLQRYHDAIKWLKEVSMGKIAPKGLPYPQDDACGNLDVWGVWSDQKFESDYNKFPGPWNNGENIQGPW